MRLVAGCCLWVALLGCKPTSASAEPPPLKGPPPAVALLLYDAELQNGWLDYGWSPRTLGKGPATVDLSDYGGWILGKPGTAPRYSGLRFKISGAREGSFVVRLEGGGKFERVVAVAAHRVAESFGFAEYFVPMSQLNPEGRAFDQVVFQGNVKGALKGVRIDAVGLTELGGGQAPLVSAVEVKLAVDCGAIATPVSPYIYGVALDFQRHDDDAARALGATARRWGGNNSSRYNWKLGNAWNAAKDYYFMNADYPGVEGWSWKTFLAQQRSWGLRTALTLPTLGWVAKDTTSTGFPVSAVPSQQHLDPERKTAGNGRTPSGAVIASGPPTRTSVEAPPSFIAEWVKELEKAEGADTLLFYILDNEPGLWHDTHRDVHPLPLSYDELWQRTRDYGQAVKKAQPGARVAGPAEWGWTAYFDSPLDTSEGRVTRMLRSDRRAHGDLPLVEWWLKQAAAHEKKTGQRLIDVFNLHFYPQGQGVGTAENGAIDPATNALRLRSTRALWDPTYKDESWIGEPVMLIPRMKKWVADHAPGLDLAIGEYSFGAQDHPSGALAQAEALGRFGQQGLYAAFVWQYPPKDSAAAQAFHAFRNYDGKGARFLDASIPATATGPASLFASRSADGNKLVLVALNLDPQQAALASLALKGCGAVKRTRLFQTTFGPKGLEALEAGPAEVVPMRPYSITVVELEVTP